MSLCQKAALSALRSKLDSSREEGSSLDDMEGCCVKWGHFEKALQTIFPQTSPETLKYYQDFKKRQKNVFNSEI